LDDVEAGEKKLSRDRLAGEEKGFGIYNLATFSMAAWMWSRVNREMRRDCLFHSFDSLSSTINMTEQYSVEQIKDLLKEDDRVQLAGVASLSPHLEPLDVNRLS